MARRKLTIMNAKMLYLNFRGLERGKNRVGDRNFCVYIDPNDAQAMADDGWNVKYQINKTDPSDQKPFISVAVSYSHIPPKVYIRNDGDRNETLLDEESVGLIDTAEIVGADVRINPRFWTDDRGNTRIKAYLDELHVTIYADEMDAKYRISGEDDPPFDV